MWCPPSIYISRPLFRANLMPKFPTCNATLACATKAIMLFTKSCGPLPKHQLQHYPSLPFFSLKFCTSTSVPHSSTASSPEIAFKASRKADSVLALFTTQGFSNSQIRDIMTRHPWLLSSDPDTVLLPKFQFLLSKGASTSDIVNMITKNPKFLARSLENHMIPAYEFIRGFLQSDKQTIACMNHYSFLSVGHVSRNVKLLLDQGMTHSNIALLFRSWPTMLRSPDLLNTVEELKQLGFNSSTSTFSVAFIAKRTVSKARWAEKIDTFKRWGWSQEQVLQAFKKQPYCMLTSPDKINAVISFWVNQLGLNSLDLVKAPGLFLLSLDKRITPRASVVQFLVSKGLRKKDAGIITPYAISEKLFLEKFVICFKEDSSHLLKLYEEKMNLANSMEEPSPSA